MQSLRVPLDAQHGQALALDGLHHSIQRPLGGLPPRSASRPTTWWWPLLVTGAAPYRAWSWEPGARVGCMRSRPWVMLWLLPMSWMKVAAEVHVQILHPDRFPNTGICFSRPTPPAVPLTGPAPSPVSQPQSSWPYRTGCTSPRRLRGDRHSDAAPTSAGNPPTGTPLKSFHGVCVRRRIGRGLGEQDIRFSFHEITSLLSSYAPGEVFLVGLRNSNCLAEFRPSGGRNKLNLEKVAAQSELPEGQERVAWAMYVTFSLLQAGKCRSVKLMCQWHISSVAPPVLQVESFYDAVSACTRLQSSEKMLAFFLKGR